MLDACVLTSLFMIPPAIFEILFLIDFNLRQYLTGSLLRRKYPGDEKTPENTGMPGKRSANGIIGGITE